MGSSQSSNIAEAVSNVANSISTNTTTTQHQINDITTKIKINKCGIGGNFNVNDVSEFIAKSRQIVQAFQQNNIQNNISQKMIQLAQSKVGALGLGSAESNNFVSTVANTSTNVSNSVYTLSSQSSFTNTDITCDEGTTVGGNFNINLSNVTNFWSDQGVKSSQIQDITNDIVQDISQTAKSTVEGIGAGLLGILAIIAALLFALASPIAESVSSLKMVIAVTVLIGIVILIIYLWLINFKPFFSTPITCLISGTSNSDTCSDCKNLKLGSFTLKNPPIKYMFNIIGSGTSKSKYGIGMLNMALFKTGTTYNYNQGFNAYECLQFADKDPTLWNKDTTFAKYGVPQLPNPLYIPTNENGDYYIIPDVFNTSSTVSTTTDDNRSPEVLDSVILNTYPKQIQTMKKDDYNKNTSKDSRQTILALLNEQGWNDYLNPKDETEKVKRILHARYVLTTFLGVDNHFYIYNKQDNGLTNSSNIDEEIDIDGNMILASEASLQNKGYKYSNFNMPPLNNLFFGIDGYGTITGMIGECDSRTNKTIKFFTGIGNYIIFAILVIIILIIFIKTLQTKKQTTNLKFY